MRDLALRLLGQRDHSAHELGVKLIRKVRAHPEKFPSGDPAGAVDSVLRDLTREKRLDDHRFALARTEQKRRSCHGDRRIRRDLLRRGIDAKIIDSVLLEISGQDEALLAAIALHVKRHGEPLERPDLRRLFRRMIQLGHAPAEIRQKMGPLFRKVSAQAGR